MHRDEYIKECVGTGIFFVLVTGFDLRYLNRINGVRSMGPLFKFSLINLLHAPLYYYFYHKIANKHLDLKKYMVKKYLILVGEILFKRWW